MKKHVSGIALVFALSLTSYSCGAFSREPRLKSEGDKLVARIERFKEERRRLPVSLSEIG